MGRGKKKLTRGLIHHGGIARDSIGSRQGVHRLLAYLRPNAGPVDPVLPLLDLLARRPFGLSLVSTIPQDHRRDRDHIRQKMEATTDGKAGQENLHPKAVVGTVSPPSRHR